MDNDLDCYTVPKKNRLDSNNTQIFVSILQRNSQGNLDGTQLRHVIKLGLNKRRLIETLITRAEQSTSLLEFH